MKDARAEIGEPRKWVQILNHLLHEIETGQLEEGDLIGVARVAKEFKTTRETASKAIRLLAEHDIVRRGPFGYEVPKSLLEELLAVSGEPDVPDEEKRFRVRGSCLHLLEFIEAIPDSLESELYAYLDQLGPLAANGHSL